MGFVIRGGIAAVALAVAACGGSSNQPVSSVSTISQTDQVPPEILSVSASRSRLTAPGTVELSASVRDPGSGILKVEFYKKDDVTPFSISVAPPYTASVTLGKPDQGQNSFFVKVFDMAVNNQGAIQSNSSSSLSSPVHVMVEIPPNLLKFAGTLGSGLSQISPVDLQIIQSAGFLPNAVFGSQFYMLGLKAGEPKNARYLFKVDLDSGGLVSQAKLPEDVARESSGQEISEAIAVDPQNFNHLVFIDSQTNSDSSKWLFDSTDSGVTWNRSAIRLNVPMVFGALDWNRLMHLTFAQTKSRLFFYSGSDNSSFSGSSNNNIHFAWSDDFGKNWSANYGQGLTRYESLGSVRSTGNGDVVYVYQGYGFKRTRDSGSTFEPCGQFPYGIDAWSARRGLRVIPGNPNKIIVAGYSYGGSRAILLSNDACATWQTVEVPEFVATTESSICCSSSQTPGKLVVSRTIPGLLYLIGPFGVDGGSVLRSSDGGQTWVQKSYFDPLSRNAVSRVVPGDAFMLEPKSNGDVDLIFTVFNEKVRYSDNIFEQ